LSTMATSSGMDRSTVSDLGVPNCRMSESW
jgi:hypothetical protein